MTAPQRPESAVVIGASMAGLLAARVLAERFERVLVLERDTLPAVVAPRKGAPQSEHAHVLLGGGQRGIDQLFPGIVVSLIGDGVPYGHGRFYTGGGFLKRSEDAPASLFVSRPRLELEVRRRVRALSNVEIVERCVARGLATSDDGRRVTGVECSRALDSSATELLRCALVVDASGRGSQAGAWLERLGYQAPQTELVEVDMGYCSRLYRRQSQDLDGDLMVAVAPSRQSPLGCAVLAQEGDRWIVTVGGYFGDHPPADERGFLEFARRLPVREVYDLVRRAEPLSELVGYRFRANQRRRYERLERLPEGFLVIGDALCSFTPIYGQGMSVATLEALALRDALAHHRPRLATRFYAQACRAVDHAWTISVGNDLRLADHPASRRLGPRMVRWYLGKLQTAAHRDAVLADAFRRVSSLLEPPAALMRPPVVARVLYRSFPRDPTAIPRRGAGGRNAHPSVAPSPSRFD